MRTMRNLFLLSAILTLCRLTILAEQPGPHFNPGEWEINSVTTSTGGRAVSSTTNLCATEEMDFWKVAQAGLVCKPPKSHPEASGGIRVRVSCDYDGEHLHSEIRSDVIETFSNHGNSFNLTGTTTTDTVYQGIQPKRTSVQLKAEAHRTGPCH
jgi:hypothetical protein